MLDTVVGVLARTREASAWRIVERQIEGEELYLIGQRVDMRRSKKVRHLVLTVYNDFEEAGERYRGSMTLRLHPSQDRRLLRRAVQEAARAARFVRNAYYPLVEPGRSSGGTSRLPESRFDGRPLPDWLPELGEALPAAGGGSASTRVNSAELFLQKVRRRVVNSQGVDVGYHSYDGYLELIVEGGEVELYKALRFADFDPVWLRGGVRRQLELCADRAVARPMPRLDNPAVLLTGEAVSTVFFHERQSYGTRLGRIDELLCR